MKDCGKSTPRRPIERENSATLHAAVPLDTWQAMYERPADDAPAGHAKARVEAAKAEVEAMILGTKPTT